MYTHIVPHPGTTHQPRGHMALPGPSHRPCKEPFRENKKAVHNHRYLSLCTCMHIFLLTQGPYVNRVTVRFSPDHLTGHVRNRSENASNALHRHLDPLPPLSPYIDIPLFFSPRDQTSTAWPYGSPLTISQAIYGTVPRMPQMIYLYIYASHSLYTYM